jgi:type I restriction enzyme, S subunit
MSAVPFALPPFNEQQEIAHILGALDDKIELNRRMNRTLEAMAAALFKSWFVDFDPVTAKAEGHQPYGMNAETAALFPSAFKDSQLGPIPQGWSVETIGDVCKVGRGASPRPINQFMNGTVPWFKIADATASASPFIFSTQEKVTEGGALKSVRLQPGSLVLSNSATIGMPFFLGIEGCIHDGWLHFSDYRGTSPLAVYHALYTLADEMSQIASGSVQDNLNIGLVSNLKIPLPSVPVVETFTKSAQRLFNKIENNERQSRTLAAIRDTLLPKLLSGEIRVKEAEHVSAAT